ncbi:MAG: Ig-like domain-containing protein [Nonlabens sp.]
MKIFFRNLLYIVLLTVVVVRCAQRGNPSGGPVDIEPPVIKKIAPANYTANFVNQKITIEFDEYITLKDLQQQLVVSPPLEYRPIIKPQGGVARKLTIEIQDTLKDDTTYVLNFGEAIVDNNEANAYPFFRYVFSTGAVIDSLTLEGRVANAYEYVTDDFVSVLLYEINEQYTDSAVYNLEPNYVLNTRDSLLNFKMQNLRAGRYKMLALKETSSNLRFNPEIDKIGFVSGEVQLPNQESYELRLFTEKKKNEVKKVYQVTQNRIDVAYTGNRELLVIEPLVADQILQSRITKLDETDTLNYWYRKAPGIDSIQFLTSMGSMRDTFNIKFKKLQKDTLTISKQGKFSLGTNPSLKASTPMEQVDKSLVKVLDRDSTEVPFDIQLDKFKNRFEVVMKTSELQQYKLELLPDAVRDFYGATNPDTLNFNFATRSLIELATVIVDLKGGTQFPVVVQLVSASGQKLLAQEVARENKRMLFEFLDPAEFQVRIIYDTNDNGKYDTGDFLKGIQPERVYYTPAFSVQSNWEYVQTINLE